MKLNDILIEQVELEPYKKDISQALNARIRLYRGASTYSEPVKLVDPYSFRNPRSSLQGNNALNNWMSSDPAWKQYPPRNRSVIMTTSKRYAEEFGETIYRVYPFNGAVLGVCGTHDIIDIRAFPHFTNFSGCGAVAAECLSFFITHPSIISYYNKRITDDYKSIVEYLKWLQEFAEKKPKIFAIEAKHSSVAPMFEYLVNSGDFVHAMSELLSPEKNDFQLTTTSVFDPIPLSERNPRLSRQTSFPGREVWTDDHCLLVRTK